MHRWWWGWCSSPEEGFSHIYGCAQKLEGSPREPAGRVSDNAHEIARVANPIMHQPQHLRRKHNIFIQLLFPGASSSFSPALLLLLPRRRGCVWYVSSGVRNRTKPQVVGYSTQRDSFVCCTQSSRPADHPGICCNLDNVLLAMSNRSRRKFKFLHVVRVHIKSDCS